MIRGCVLFSIVLGCSSCVGPGLITDGSSVSIGSHSRGALRQGCRLAFQGDGYLVPQRWQNRKRNFGTDELVQLIVRTARRVNRNNRNAILGIADLSSRGGGPTPEHRSHWSGRDVDFLLFATDITGKPIRPSEMLVFDKTGMVVVPASQPVTQQTTKEKVSTHAEKVEGKLASTVEVKAPAPPPAGAKLDLASNWALVKTLVTDPLVSVQWIFLGRPLANLLLQYARRQQEPELIIQRVMTVMHQPSDSQSHMDHLHVRIFCSLSDRHLGCQHWGPSRWLKKEIKYLYLPPRQVAEIPIGLAQASRLLRFRGL